MLESSRDNSSPDGHEERRSMWDFIAKEYDLRVTFDDFLTVDKYLDTDPNNLTGREIVEAVHNANEV